MEPSEVPGQAEPSAAHPSPYTGRRPVFVIPKPRDYVVWSLLSTLYVNFCCLGFAALLFSIKTPPYTIPDFSACQTCVYQLISESRDCKVMDDPEGASRNGRRAKYLNIAALTMGVVFFIIFITMIFITIGFLHLLLQRFVDHMHESETDHFISG